MKEKLVELLRQCVMQNITLDLDCWDAIDVNYDQMADSLMESGVIVAYKLSATEEGGA